MRIMSDKFFFCIIIFFFCFFICTGTVLSNETDYKGISMKFKNFLQCELTRVDAPDYFNGKPFKITAINMFDVKNEGDLTIVTGMVKCWVVNRFETLFAAVGVKQLLGHEKVYYLLIKKQDFSILATQLGKYPYKERCAWSRYSMDVR